MLNPAAAAIPWELMHDGFDRSAEPMAVASGMIRQLLLSDERAHVLRSPSNTALVVGNPKVDDRTLPVALWRGRGSQLAWRGCSSDERGYDVTLLLEEGADPLSVLSAVHEKPWRILHLAAHGVFEFDREDGKGPVSGLVLGDGLFFTAAEADQLRYVPELVFINCCHLGQTRGDSPPRVAFHKLAANLATQFIKMGARAVVAAGWAVDDAAAKTFATAFYRRLLKGDCTATRSSRRGATPIGCMVKPTPGARTSATAIRRSRSRRDGRSIERTSSCPRASSATWLERHAATVRERGCSDVLLAELEVQGSADAGSVVGLGRPVRQVGSRLCRIGKFRAGDLLLRTRRARRGGERADQDARTARQLQGSMGRFAGAAGSGRET